MTKSSPYSGQKMTILGISITKREGIFASHDKRDAHPGKFFIIVPLLTLIVFLAFRAAVLFFSHSTGVVDGAMQTWFALNAFGQYQQLGEDFQSYLGITSMLFLMPFYVIFGANLYASSMAASTALAIGYLATMHGLLRLMRGLTPGMRWILVAAGVAVLCCLSQLSPGASLRPIRWALPFLMLPFVMPLLWTMRDGHALRSGLWLGIVAGIGLLWSNDAGVPAFGALGVAILLCGTGSWRRTMIALSGYVAGALLSAGAILFVFTHGAPWGWLSYNFGAVREDQIWYFPLWGRETRVLNIWDIGLIVAAMGKETLLALGLLLVSLGVAIGLRVCRRGSPVRLSAFIFLGLSALGTSLIPQIWGHVSGNYNGPVLLIGYFSPFIVFQRYIFRTLCRFRKYAYLSRTTVLVILSLLIFGALWITALYSAVRIGCQNYQDVLNSNTYQPCSCKRVGCRNYQDVLNSGRWITALYSADRTGENLDTIPVSELGFRVDSDFARDVVALRQLRNRLDERGVPRNERIQSTYPSAIGILLNAEVPTAFGSIIHVFGDKGREHFVDVIKERRVVYAATLLPVALEGDKTGPLQWAAGWNIRSSWPYFRALYRNYQPVARNARHLLWKRRDKPLSEPEDTISAECSAIQHADGTAELAISSSVDGHMEVNIALADLPDTGHGEILVAREISPYTENFSPYYWYDAPRYRLPNRVFVLRGNIVLTRNAPRYGLPNRMTHSLFLPVAAGHRSRIELEILGGRHKIKIASCEARLTPVMDISTLSELPSFTNYFQISPEVF